jgi:hypothetical protein
MMAEPPWNLWMGFRKAGIYSGQYCNDIIAIVQTETAVFSASGGWLVENKEEQILKKI